MVRRISKALKSIIKATTVSLICGILKILSTDARLALIRGAVRAMFIADKDASFRVVVEHISGNTWAPDECEFLVINTCNLLDPANVPDSIVETFERVSGGTLYYSQEGEDIVLDRLIGPRREGFFVDIGAHHATRFSNTYALYRRGWRGLNVDATPGSMDSFKRVRPDDTNLEQAVSDRKEILTFSLFREGALNTFDRELAQTYIDNGWELKGTVELVPQTLADVLGKHLDAGQKIDLMSVDVEGEDLAVLRSNDWEKYCPDFIIVEALDTPLICLNENPVVVFLKDKGFEPVSRLFNSIIFKRAVSVCAEF